MTYVLTDEQRAWWATLEPGSREYCEAAIADIDARIAHLDSLKDVVTAAGDRALLRMDRDGFVKHLASLETSCNPEQMVSPPTQDKSGERTK